MIAKGPSALRYADQEYYDSMEFILYETPKLMRQYGDIIRLEAEQYIITGPNAFKHILKTNVENYSKNNRVYDRMKLVMGEGLIVSEGNIWKQHREVIQTCFTKDKLSLYAKIMIDSTLELTQHWKQNKPQEIDLLQEINHLTLMIAFKAFSHYEPSHAEMISLQNTIKRGARFIVKAGFPTLWYPSIPNILFFWSLSKMHRILNKIIDKKRLAFKENRLEENNFLSLLIKTQETMPNFPLSNTELLDEFKTILLTGHETTACGLVWAFYLLNQNPQYLNNLQMELKRVLKGNPPSFADCNNLPITKAIFLEALRLYPPIWCINRRALQDDIVEGYEIPEESFIIMNIQALHRNPFYWKNPDQFMPERFLGVEENSKHPFAFLPFGLGPHGCIGSQFALTEGILLLATLAQNFTFDFIKKSKNIEPLPYLTLRPPNKMMSLKPVISHIEEEQYAAALP